MKLLVDLLACQTYSRFRGIGRYTLSLTQEMAKLRGANKLIVLANSLYQISFEELRQKFIRLLPPGAFLPYSHDLLQYDIGKNFPSQFKIAETLIEHAYQAIAPDVVLTPSLFESWGYGEQSMVPLPDKKYPNQKRAVILYDIIPYLFPKYYLDPSPDTKEWYLERVKKLHNFDLILAISEATRKDAINILGLKPEKVVNILGAASSHFKKMELTKGEKQNFLQRFGILRHFVLYIGGNDYRKNMYGALRAFANLPREVIAKHQLVLNDVGDEKDFRGKARKLGLSDSDIVIFNRVNDEDLVIFYNLCRLFIFPSLYEGFGLPVLEAMTCGAPVIASNNSSIPEVVGRSDALFDATNDQSITAAMQHVLTDEAFREELAAYGPGRAKQFSWENSAQIAWDAIEKVQEDKKLDESRVVVSIPPIQSRMRIAYVSPLPPQKSGIADYSADLLPYLSKHFEIDLFSDIKENFSVSFLRDDFKTYYWTELRKRRDIYEAVIYHVGNSHFHTYMPDLLREIPGVVVLHDFFLSNLPYVEEYVNGKKDVFVKEIDDNHGLRSVVNALKNHVVDLNLEETREQWPINWKVLKFAQELIVHSKHQNELIQQFYTHGWTPNTTLIKQIHETTPQISRSKKQALRQELGLDPNAFIFCSFGLMASTKLNLSTIQAFSQMYSTSNTNVFLIFVGQLEGGILHEQQVLKIINELNLSERIFITGYVNKKQYEKYLACADAAIQLRAGSRGETSRAVLDCMAYGLPCIINAHGALNDYNADDVIKLSDSFNLDELKQTMVRLQTDESFRVEKGQRARNLIIEQHDPDKIAANYANVIVRAAQMKEQKFFAPLIDSIAQLKSSPALMQSSSCYAAANLTLRCQPRILMEITSLEVINVRDDKRQAVSEIIKELFSTDDKSIHMELVHLSDGRLLRACKSAEDLFELPRNSLGPDTPIFIQPGDILLMFDSLLSTSIQSLEIIENIRKRGGKVITLVYSISETLLTTLAMGSDMILCRSREIAENINTFIEEHQLKLQHPPGVFYLHSEANTRAKKGIETNMAVMKDTGKQFELTSLNNWSIWKESALWMLNTPDIGQTVKRFSNEITEEHNSTRREDKVAS